MRTNILKIVSFLINNIYPFLILYLICVFLCVVIVSILFTSFDIERFLISFGIPFIFFIIIKLIKKYYLNPAIQSEKDE